MRNVPRVRNRGGEMAGGELDLTGRVKVLEHGFEKLETRVEAGFADVSKGLRMLGEQIAAKGQPLPFKEIITTAVATAALVAYLLTALNSWFDQKAAPLTLSVQRLSEQDKNGELSVLKYRVLKLEQEREEMTDRLMRSPVVPRQQ